MVAGRARRFVLAGAALAALPLACQIVAGIEPVPKDKASDGGAPAGSKDGASSSDPCAHARPPGPPEVDDDRDGVLPPFYLAVRSLSTFGGSGPFGYDLDNVCTCDKRSGTARQGVSSCTPKADDCDEDGGIDNKGTKLFESMAPTGFSVDSLINDDIASGARGLLIWISKYNGKANDSEVFVGLMVSNGIRDGSGCNSVIDTTGHGPPGWCGHDRWSYATEYVKPGTKEPAQTANAYVVDHVLVFQGDLPIRVFFGTTAITFGSPISAGRLEKKPDGTWKLDTVLGGRIPVTELLEAVGNFPDPSKKPAKLCNSLLFPTVKAALCSSVDINRSSRLDFKEGTCDAVSSAVSLTAEQVDVGDLYDHVDDPTPCSASAVAAGTYTCP